MNIQLTNTLTRKKEEFKPIHSGKIGMYSCGPTVYSTATIGNFRTNIFSDIIRRVFEFNGYEVKQIMNITDVGHLVGDGDVGEDKMIKAMREEGKTAWEIAEYYTAEFLKDMELLNIKQPSFMPKATAHINEQIELIEELEKKGLTYKISDGIYFDTSEQGDYGEISGQRLEEKEEGARVAVNVEKKNPTDFALWKFSPEDEKRDMEWESPWGTGFPGWHIECSAMAEEYLDSPFDIHTGGIDLIPVHHTNEIAQTQGARGNKLANYWLHGEFLLIDGGKMSKSLGNVFTIQDIIEKGFDPIAFRYFTFGAHYKSSLNFTWESIGAAQNALNNLYDEMRDWDAPSVIDKKIVEEFLGRINDDFDMPGVLAVLWNIVNSDIDSHKKSATVLKMDQVLGLNFENYVAKPLKISKDVQLLFEKREDARNSKNWDLSDEIRSQIELLGFLVEDTEDGQKLREKH